MMEVPESYHQSAVKLMIVGQETRGWAEEIKALTTVRELMSFYSGFNLGEKYRASPFWQAAQQFHRSLNPKGPERSYLWSNLIKVSQQKKRPIPSIEENICNLGLLQAEIEITRPSVVVFFTGPSYDNRLKSTFSGITFDSSSRRLSRLVHPQLPHHSYRTYHPNYLRRSKNNRMVLDEIKKLVVG